MLRLTVLLALLALLAPAQDHRDPARAAALVRAYPAFVRSVAGSFVLWRDGTRTPLARPHPATPFEARLNGADLLDQFAQPYPAGCPAAPAVPNFDPGRLRDEAFFARMYGGSWAAVQAHLTTVDWFGQPLQVTRVNGVDLQLRAVERDLAAHPEWRPYLTPSAGVDKWRDIEGTARRSMHAYGAAIDLNTRYARYWRWPWLKGAGYPLGIVRAFERRGFIWGGRWFHTDTMHFEYRPELLAPAGTPAPCPHAAGQKH